ncbi:MAG: hypothetical protein RPT25_00645 [Cycloclasticus sp.]
MEITARPTVMAFGKSLMFLPFMVYMAFAQNNDQATPFIWLFILGLAFMLFMKTRFTRYQVTADHVLIKSFGLGEKRVKKGAIQSTEIKPKGIRAGTLTLNTAFGEIKLHNLSLKSARLIENALI